MFSIWSGWAFACVLLMLLLGFVYIRWVRPYLKTLPGFRDAYARERSLWEALKVWVIGRREVVIGIWGQIVAFAPDALQQLSAGGIDLKALLGLPDLWAAWVIAMIPLLMLIFRAKREE